MYKKCHQLVNYLHAQSEFTLLAFHRLGIVVIILGACFSLLCFPALQLLNNPVQFAKVDYLFINTIELDENRHEKDVNIDGTLSGMSTGAALCQGIPIIGAPLGLLLGAYVGHQADESF